MRGGCGMATGHARRRRRPVLADGPGERSEPKEVFSAKGAGSAGAWSTTSSPPNLWFGGEKET